MNRFINDKNLKIKLASILLIFLVASISVWSPSVITTGSINANGVSSCTSCGTTFHSITVNIEGEEIILNIEPLLPPETGCASCAGCSNDGKTSNVQIAVLGQSDNRTEFLVAYEVNGTTFEFRIATTLLWTQREIVDGVDRSASFNLTEIIIKDTSFLFYGLAYMVRHPEYHLVLYTGLIPLNSEIYNVSLTVLNYVPVRKSGLVSLDAVKFNSSITLSQQYQVLGKVAKELGKLYENNETLAQLAIGYRTIEGEAKHLANIVRQRLQESDKGILQSYAIIKDNEPCSTDQECIYYTGSPYACCQPYGCEDVCYSCQENWQCETTYGEGWTCIDGYCRGVPGGMMPPWDYWLCVGICMGQFCLLEPVYCYNCVTACGACFAAPTLITCLPCITCLGLWALPCMFCCLLSPNC